MPGLYDDIDAKMSQQDKRETNVFDQVSSKVSSEAAPADSHPLFERLNRQLDEATSGLTAFDLMALRGPAKSVMLTLMRDTKAVEAGITEEELREKLADVPEDLPDVLRDLAENSWLLVSGEPPKIRYRVHMRRKKGKEAFGIWSALQQRLNEKKS